MGLGGSDTDSYCPGTGATAILASCLRSLGKGVGVNYNQTVKAIHTNFNDRYFDESNGRFVSFNQSKRLLNRWKKPGDITDIPRHGVYTDRKSTRLNSSHRSQTRMPSSA